MLDLSNSFLSAFTIGTQAAASTVTGTAVDCENTDGPVYASCSGGSITGTPDASSVIFTLYEADASNGTGEQAVATVSGTVTLTAAGSMGIIRGIRTKRYVYLKAVISFTGGSTPKATPSGTIFAQKKILS